MVINELKKKDGISENLRLSRIFIQFNELLKQLKQKQLPHRIIETLNQDIEELNSTPLTGNDLRKLIKRKQTKILKVLEKDLKIVPKDYYRNLWLAVGTSTFGIPIGMAFSSIFANNLASFIVVGLPVGLVIGMSLGSSMDKKAYNEGRQLDIYIKY